MVKLLKLTLPKRSADWNALLNELYSGPVSMDFAVGAQEFSMVFPPVMEKINWGMRVEGSWCLVDAGLYFESQGWLEVISSLLPGQLSTEDMLAMEPELLAVLAETVLDEKMSALETISGHKVAISSISVDGLAPPADAALLPFEIQRAGELFCRGCLAVSGRTDMIIKTLILLLKKSGHTRKAQMIDVPLLLKFEVGETVLQVHEFQKLAPGDVVALDRFYIGDDSRVKITSGGRALFWATHNGKELQLVENIMSEDENVIEASPEGSVDTDSSTGDGAAPGTADAGAIPVTLNLVLDSQKTTLKALNSLSPGQVIPTSKSVDSPVAISVNGKVVGSGDLVDVEGKIGVRILQFLGKGTS